MQNELLGPIYLQFSLLFKLKFSWKRISTSTLYKVEIHVEIKSENCRYIYSILEYNEQ